MGRSFGYGGMQGWRSNMEDAHLGHINIGGQGPDTGVFGVFDGHGGAGAAKYAAAALASRVANVLAEKPSNTSAAIRRAFAELDEAMSKVVAEYRGEDATEDPGSTATTVVVTTTHIVFANLGDSRAFLVRGGRITFVTQDHKPESQLELERIERAGGFVARNRVCNCLAVSRAFGDHLFKDRSTIKEPEKLMVSPVPEVTVIPRHEDDEFIFLGCDGVFDVLKNQSVADLVSNKLLELESLSEVAMQVTQLAFHKNSTDNISSMVVVLPGAARLQQVDGMIDDLFDDLLASEGEGEEPSPPQDEPAPSHDGRTLSISHSAGEVEGETEA